MRNIKFRKRPQPERETIIKFNRVKRVKIKKEKKERNVRLRIYLLDIKENNESEKMCESFQSLGTTSHI